DAPGCEIGGGAHRLAELAIVGHVNTGVELPADNVRHGASQQRVQFLLMRGTGRRTGPGPPQPLGSRQTAGVGGDDPIRASHHGWRPSCLLEDTALRGRAIAYGVEKALRGTGVISPRLRGEGEE